MISDIEIIRRVRNGQVREFRYIVDRYQKRVFALAYRMLGKREDAEDAVQDTFLRVYQGLDSFLDDNPVWPWLRRVAVNCCLRKLPKEFPTDEMDVLVDAEQPFVDGVQAQIMQKLDCQLIAQAVNELPLAYRVVVVLRYYDDLMPTEVAELLGEPASTIRVRLHRALKMLFDRMVVNESGM